MTRKSLEQSREIRQWIGLFGKAAMGAISLDYVFNDGGITKKAIAKGRANIAKLKAKFSKNDEETVINFVNK